MRGPHTLALLALAIVAVSLLAPIGAQAYIAPPKFGDARIVDPEYSRPVFVDAGGTLNVTMVCATQCEGPYTVELIKFNTTITAVAQAVDLGNGTVILHVPIPAEAQDGLYDIVVYANNTKLTWMPRAVVVKHGPLNVLTIMHMTDIHLGASDKGIPNTLKNTRYIMLSDLVERLYGVNVAIITGDIADVGTDIPSLKAIWEQYNQFRLPTFMIPGNHDWAQVPNLDAFLNNYYGRYVNSKQYWYRVIDGFILIGLDSLGDGYLPKYELDFLNETLNKYPDKIAILFFHHPIFNQPGEYEGPVDNWISNVYSSWRDHEDSLRTLIKIIEEHPNVVAVLAGHIHRDADAILHIGDRKVYFITTTTANHGTPTYWGFKIIRVYSNGTVQVILPPGKKDLFNGRTSFNTEYYKTYEITNDDHTTVVWQLYASRLAELDVSNVTLYFYMNATGGPYKIFDREGLVKGYKVYKYEDYIVYQVQASVPNDRIAYVVVSNEEDKQPPTILSTSVTPAKPRAGQPVFIYVQAADSGWGLAGVEVAFRVNNGEWQTLPVSNKGGMYVARIDKAPAGTVEIVVKVWDYNLNMANKTVTLQVEAPQTTTTTTTQQETTTTTTTAQTTTTSQATTTTTTPAATTEAAREAASSTTTTTGGGKAQLAAAVVIAVIVIALIATLVKR